MTNDRTRSLARRTEPTGEPPNFMPAPVPVAQNAGTVVLQTRELSEVMGRIQVAKSFPRDIVMAQANILQQCRRRELAGIAMYAYSRGGSTVTGPSIRLMETIANAYGNIAYGVREVDRRDGESEMEAYAWDVQTNVRVERRFLVRHWRDTKQGGHALTDERDIYEIGANMGARRMRACLQQVVPRDLIDSAVEECKRTVTGDGGKTVDIVREMQKLVGAFSKIGITPALIEERLLHPLDQVVPEEFSELVAIYNAVKEDKTRASEFFAVPKRMGAVESATAAEAALFGEERVSPESLIPDKDPFGEDEA